MPEFAEGDEVQVYDGDEQAWVLGVVEDVGEDLMVVRTELWFEGRPLLFGIPRAAFSMLVRKVA